MQLSQTHNGGIHTQVEVENCFQPAPVCVFPHCVCEKATSETPSFSPTIFTWYQSLVRGKELKKANQVRGVLVRGPLLLSVFEFGSKSLQVAQPEVQECTISD